MFDTETNWRLICECVTRRSRRGPCVRRVGQGGERDEHARGNGALRRARPRDLGVPERRLASERTRRANSFDSGAAQEIYDRAGDWVAITAPARFLWIATHEPDVFASIAHVGMLGDWILTRLSGAFVTDPSLGSSSGMFDLEARTGPTGCSSICGLERSVFPAVVESGTVVGAVTPQAAAMTGLREGTPVVVGGADTQLALLGIGVTQPGRFTVVGGSFWQHTVVLDEPLIDPGSDGLRTLCHTVPDRWMMEGIGFYCGIVMRWFRDAFCELETGQRRRQASIDVYALLERKAAGSRRARTASSGSSRT